MKYETNGQELDLKDYHTHAVSTNTNSTIDQHNIGDYDTDAMASLEGVKKDYENIINVLLNCINIEHYMN